MKKILSFLMCLTILLGIVPFARPAEALLYRKGDYNGDNAVNAKDGFSMALYLSGVGEELPPALADLNMDEQVNAKDYFLMKLHFSGVADLEKAPGFGGYTIGGRDIANFTVVNTCPDNPNMVFAAEELCKYTLLGDGSTLESIVCESALEAPENSVIFLEDTTGELGTDGFSIKYTEGDLIITAAPKRGSMYAVYHILEEYFGFAFYEKGEYDLDKYSASDIPADMDYTFVPKLRYRCITIDSFGSAYVESTTVKRRLNGASSVSALQNPKYGYGVERLRANAHSFDIFLPMDQVTEATNLDKRCLSKAALVDICADNMIKLVEERIAAGASIGNEITEISCSYADGDVPCTCRTCNKVFNEEGQRHSGNLVRFVNKVYEKFNAVYPEITFITNAYGTWHDAPAVSSLADGIVLLYCWNGCSNHLLGQPGCTEKGNYLGTTNIKTEADFLAWKEKCSEIYVWYYPTNIYYMLSPLTNYFSLYNDIRWFINNGATGFYVKGSDGVSFEGLCGYLISILMWDPDISYEDYDLKLKEYLRAHYGYGWTYIYEYMLLATEIGDECGCVLNDFELPFDMYSKTALAENYFYMKELFKNAYDMADTAEQRENIELLSCHMRFLGLASRYYVYYENGTAETRAEFAADWEELYNYIVENNVRTAHNQIGIEKPFTLSENPMVTIYPEAGSGQR